MRKTELEERYRSFQSFFGGLIADLNYRYSAYAALENEGHQLDLGKNGFNLRPDLIL